MGEVSGVGRVLNKVPSHLPWTSEGPTEGTAICLSGGGLRSAAFSMGALQALQEQRDLLWGEERADLVVAVSGGSYIAASHALTAGSIPPGAPPPLSDEQAETEWIKSNPRYIFGGGVLIAALRLGSKFLFPGAINVAAMVSLFAWVGFMIANFDWTIATCTPWIPAYPLLGRDEFGLATDALVFVALGYFGTLLWYQEGPRRWLGVAMVLGAVMLSPSALRAGGLSPLTSEPTAWLTSPWPLLIALSITSASIAATLLASKARQRVVQLSLGALGLLSPWMPRLFGLVVLSLVASTWASHIETNAAAVEPSPTFVVLFAATLTAPLMLGALAGRLSLHRSYRSLLSKCFAVRRDSESTVERCHAAALSGLGDSMGPRLVIAATANVVTRRNGTLSSHHPFAFSHDVCGIPGIAEAVMSTSKLELLWGVGKEPQVSLMTAVAATGAAVSPSMGRYSIGGLRPFLAAFNLRLGRWIANPLNPAMRERITAITAPEWSSPVKRMTPSLDELIQESLGFHSSGQATVYVSDGGHYDNLGILTALHARPARIWCVDASPDKKGRAKELRRIIDIVGLELPGTSISIPTIDDFLVNNSYNGSISAAGTIVYPDGTTADLRVCKLGLTEESSDWVKGFRAAERRYPYQSTTNQDYTPGRFEAYRRLGFENMTSALASFEAG